MQSIKFENAQTIFQGLGFDDKMENEFVDKFETGGSDTEFLLVRLSTFHTRMKEFLFANSEHHAGDLAEWEEIHKTLKEAECKHINVEI
jgi:hypothetical protein